MGDAEKIDTRYHYQFIHNTYAHFFKDSLDYFATYLYPRFQHTVISTYDKAVEYITKKEKYGREQDMPNLPALILNPSGDFNISDAGGKQLWRFPNLAPGMIQNIYDPIYRDDRFLINVGFSRIRGEFELLALLSSFYEFCDVKMQLIQIFGGMERYIEPRYFNSFIVIPEELYTHQFINPYTNEVHSLKWDQTNLDSSLVRTTNRNEFVYPCRIKPRYKLNSLSDNSTKHGGVDKLADWRLGINIEYEVEIPSFMVLLSNYLVENIHFEFRYGSAYSANSEYNTKDVPINREIIKTKWDFKLEIQNEDFNRDDYPKVADIDYTKHLVLKNRYHHIITSEEADSTSNIIITLPETIIDEDYLFVNGKSGRLQFNDHYKIINEGTAIELDRTYVASEEGDIFELYLYGDS